ncbi:MAG: gephyrin-like molybdotransferase Glp, partial [Candidatus Macondimonas sp.]
MVEGSAQDLTVETARARLLASVSPVAGTERLPLAQAVGRVLAEPVVAPFALPREDHSALDGYALCGSDAKVRRRLRIIGRALAGAPWSGTVAPGTCLRLMTGAVIPAGADTVIAQESVQVEDGWITLQSGLEAGENVRRAGEDLLQGREAVPAGRSLDARQIALVAALGIGVVTVLRPVRVGILSTGSELRAIGEALAPGDLYDSNRPMLAALLQRPMVALEDLGSVPDDPRQLAARLGQGADLDLLIASGGVSVGEADWVRPVLAEMGHLDFWRVAIKPGRPLAFGRLGRSWFLGLPGNPVSAYVTFRLFVLPVLERLAGMPVRPPVSLRVPLLAPLRHRPGRTSFLRAR